MKRRFRYGLAVLVLAGTAGATVAVAGPDRVKETGLEAWRAALQWAGLDDHTHESDATYWCPMHPQIKRDQPGTCPLCNMALVPLEAGAETGPPTELVLTTRQVQQAGVVTEPVVERPLRRTIDTTGRIEIDERRLAKITSWIPGKSRIVDLRVNFTGTRVEEGEVMAELYSPELISAQSEYLVTLRARSRLSGGRVSTVSGDKLLESARQKLLYWGLTPVQIDRLARSGEVLDRIPIHAPIGGTVLTRSVQEGEYVGEGELLFEIADLSELWLIADVYEEELPLVAVGQPVEITVRGIPGERFEGTVSFIDPVVQPATRTVRVRIDVPNPEGRLKPGMYARVELGKRFEETLAVPANAVLWSGQRSVVLVRQGEGTFEPHEVGLGRKWLYPTSGGERDERGLEFGADQRRYHAVRSGLEPGDQVVTSGAFLLNAESQFQSVLTKMLPAEGGERPTLEQLLGSALAEDLRSVLGAYDALREALAEDALEPVSGRAAGLATAAEALAEQAGQEDKPELAGAAEGVAAAAGASELRLAGDLEEARRGFGRVSRALITLLADHGGPALLGEELFAFECPMAGKFGYKRWLEGDAEMENPYMGQMMLKCGSEVETLQP